MKLGRCICGCGARARQRHHVIYRQHIERAAPRGLVRLSTGWVAVPRLDAPGSIVDYLERRSLAVLMRDERNLVPVAAVCHGDHHAGRKRLLTRLLPDSVFEFAVELFDGPEGAYAYLSRYYGGHDERLEHLLGRETPEHLRPAS